MAQAESRAVKYLEKNMNLLNMTGEPYEIALVTYALMLTKSSFAEYAFTLLSKHARRESMFCVFFLIIYGILENFT